MAPSLHEGTNDPVSGMSFRFMTLSFRERALMSPPLEVVV